MHPTRVPKTVWNVIENSQFTPKKIVKKVLAMPITRLRFGDMLQVLEPLEKSISERKLFSLASVGRRNAGEGAAAFKLCRADEMRIVMRLSRSRIIPS